MLKHTKQSFFFSSIVRQVLIFFAVCIFVCTFMDRSARAETDISLRLNNTLVSDAGFYAVSENNHLIQAQFSVGHKLFSFQSLGVWAEAAYALGSTKAKTFGGLLDTKTIFQTISVGSRLRYPALYWLYPYLRMGLGVGIGSVKFTASEGSIEDDLAAYFEGQLAAGVEVLWPTSWLRSGLKGLTGGLLLEIGYGVSSPIEFGMAHEKDGDKKELPLQAGTLGDFTLSGVKALIGAVLQF